MYEAFIQERIAQLRLKKGSSARDMSLSIGQNENYINVIENKKSLPSMSAFLFICEYFEITPQEFFDEGNADPVKLKAIVGNLKRLDDKSLSHIAGLAEELANR